MKYVKICKDQGLLSDRKYYREHDFIMISKIIIIHEYPGDVGGRGRIEKEKTEFLLVL